MTVSETAFKNLSLSPKTRGFTLVELLVSITVMAILLVLTLPSFQNSVMNNRISAKIDALANSLSYARNTALSQNIDVSVCPAGTAGSTTCGTSWQNGWIVVSQPTVGPAVLLQATLTGVNDPLLSAVPIGGVAASSITFDSRGLATTQANFKACDHRGGAFARSVEVLPTGFIQTGSTMGMAAWDGGALTCP